MFNKFFSALGVNRHSKPSKGHGKQQSSPSTCQVSPEVSPESSYAVLAPLPVRPIETTSFLNVSKANESVETVNSHASTRISNVGSTRRQARSSFANESIPGRCQNYTPSLCNSTGHTARSLSNDAFFIPPPDLLAPYLSLGVIAPNMPVPSSVVGRLWDMEQAQAEEQANVFKKLGVIRLAVLEDGSLWCLVSSEHLESIAAMADAGQLKMVNRKLLLSYTNGGRKTLRGISDDGYIIQNLVHHLEGADQIEDLREVLTEPLWVENKLHAYGSSAVVQDFRSYLADRKDDAHVKLLLQAFQLSLGCCLEHPGMHMLKEQMMARVMALASPSGLAQGSEPTAAAGERSSVLCRSSSTGDTRQWFEKHLRKLSIDIAQNTHQIVHLMPRSASLQQAGGLHCMTLRGHTGPIMKVLISPNGHDVMTVSQDGSAQVWDMNIGDCVMQLARETPLTDADVAPGGQMAVIASEDGHCCVWDLQSGAVKHVLKGHQAKVNAVAIDRQGLRCITASDDHSVRVWNIFNGCCDLVLSGHGEGESGATGNVFDVAISSDGVLAATVSDDFTCRVWDLDEGDGDCFHVMKGHSGWVVSVEFLGSTTELVTASHDSTARVWDGEKGKCLFTLEGHTGRLNKVVVDAGGMFAVTCSDDHTARVWDLDSGACLQVLQGHGAWINDAAITRDGSRVITVSGDHCVAMWNVKTGKAEKMLQGHSDNVKSVVLTDRGRFAVTASDDNTARVWDTQAKDLATIPKHAGRVRQLCSLPSWDQVISAGDDGDIMVWDSNTGAFKHRMHGHANAVNYLGPHLTDNMVISGSGDRQVCVWNTSTGELAATLPVQVGSRVKAMTFDRSCSKAAVVLFDGTVSVWDVQTGACVQQLIKRGQKESANVHSGGVNSIYLTKSGTQAVTTGKDSTARVWDLTEGCVTAVVTGHQDSVMCAAINPDELLLATAATDSTIIVSAMENGSSVAVLRQPFGANAKQLAFCQDGTLLVAVLGNNKAVVWDLMATENQTPLVLAAHKDEIHGACFSPVPYWRHGALVATWSQDCTVLVWRISRAQPHQPAFATQLALFMADAAITSCCFAGSASDVLVVGDATGAVHFLDLPLELQCAQR